MIEYRIEVTDSKGHSAKILLSLEPARLILRNVVSAPAGSKDGRWRALDEGFFVYNGGAIHFDHNLTNPSAWVAMYGGDKVNDNFLVFHLDDFLTRTYHANSEGEGFIYKQDYLMAEWGKLSWRLLA